MPPEQDINQSFRQRTPYSVYRLTFTLQFKNGLAAGDGNFGNEMLLARNGKGELVLRGTSIAGVLRHSYEKQYGEDTELFFGTSAEKKPKDDDGNEKILTESLLIVSDIVLNINKNTEYRRTHHLRNRHAGNVLEHGLYSIEIAPPETTAHVTLWFNETEQLKKTGKDFLEKLAGLIRGGLIFGGNSNRGIGLATANEFVYKKYSLSEKEQYAEYLNDFYTWRQDGTISDANSEKLTPQNNSDTNNLTVEFTLQIPRGQDLLIAEGNDMLPHKITAADSNDYYLLPGSTLHGLFRSWVTRLAARKNKSVSDSVKNYENKQCNIKGSEIGWMFNEKLDVNEINTKYPVENLFGSLHQSGRIHFTDALYRASRNQAEIQHRKHVALDAISGGAIEHLLFDNDVLTSGQFQVTMLVKNIQEHEAKWLAQTLKALHLGLLRVGSSKAAGRLMFDHTTYRVSGKYGDIFKNTLIMQQESVVPIIVKENVPTKRPTKNIFQANYYTGQEFDKVKKKPIEKSMVLICDKEWKLQRKQFDVPQEIAKTFEEKPNKQDVFVEFNEALEIIGLKPFEIPTVTTQSVTQTGNSRVSQSNPSLIGFPFHNPYTFIPFTKKSERHEPTLQTADEIDADRFTGIIELKITTQSPLLTIQPEKNKPKEHAEYKALTISNDVIVPATSVRGALRYLLTVVTGGPLTTLDDQLYLCQGRDLKLGPRSPFDNGSDRNSIPSNVFLARVVNQGSSKKSGTIQLGKTICIEAKTLKCIAKENQICLDTLRGNLDTTLWVDYDEEKKQVRSISKNHNANRRWQLKLSGNPIISGNKKEGLFLADNRKPIVLPPEMWQAFVARNKFGITKERKGESVLREGDLVWLQPKNTEIKYICSADDIESIQWARLGRKGIHLADKTSGVMPKHLYPDWQENDDLVSDVTDMFGQVPADSNYKNAPTFAGRIRPDNLIFQDQEKNLIRQQLMAVLASPHSGCTPFYREQPLNQNSPLRGYKVYRTSKQAGSKDPAAPWRYQNQGVYDNNGQLDQINNGRRDNNFTADLLPEGCEGTLQLSVRSLSMKELSLLILVSNNNTWRLGGGKPLGLGQCNVQIIKILDENGNEYDWKNDKRLNVLDANILKNWKKTQEPVDNVRYPRAVIVNQNSINRGGHVWFSKFGAMEIGKSMLKRMVVIDDKRCKTEVQQMLPLFSPNDPGSDKLYGYDVKLDDSQRKEYEKKRFAYRLPLTQIQDNQ